MIRIQKKKENFINNLMIINLHENDPKSKEINTAKDLKWNE